MGKFVCLWGSSLCRSRPWEGSHFTAFQILSDTSLISSVAAGCDHIDHVRTQLPYALLAAAGTVVLYLVAGPVMAVAG